MKESIQSTPERGLVAFAVVHPIISFALLVSVALGIVVGYVFLLPWLMAHLGGWSPEKSESLNSVRGLFGDSFGALTSLFSVLAMMALFLTFLYQKNQIDLQRKQLEDARIQAKYQQIPLLSVDDVSLDALMPYCARRGEVCTAFRVNYLLRTGNDYLIKDAFIKIELRCGKDGRKEVLTAYNYFAGIGGGSESIGAASIVVKHESYKDFAETVRMAAILGEYYSLSVSVTAYYRSMLGLYIRLCRSYGIRDVESSAMNLVRQWSERLNMLPVLKGNLAEDMFTCIHHFRVSMSKDDAKFQMVEFTKKGKFEDISEACYEQAVGVFREKMQARLQEE